MNQAQNSKKRCSWSTSDPLYIKYHDNEWGRPLHNDRKLFEMLVLEGMQAGLSWITILRKRQNFREAFDNFDPKKVVKYSSKKINQLLKNDGIIKNKLKIESAIKNAEAFLKVQKEFSGFDKYIWQFVNGKPIINKRNALKGIPAKTEESIIMSKDLLSRGFKFVGPTICYAYMQSTGMVNDHVVDCFRYKELNRK
jgi:DNA-3-methyladenine glycosylase I